MRRRSSSNRLSKIIKWIVGIVGVALSGVLLVVAGYVIAGFTGFIGGHIIKFFFGTWVEMGLNTIFNTTRFTAEMLPYITTALTLMTNFIKPIVNLKINAKGD